MIKNAIKSAGFWKSYWFILTGLIAGGVLIHLVIDYYTRVIPHVSAAEFLYEHEDLIVSQDECNDILSEASKKLKPIWSIGPNRISFGVVDDQLKYVLKASCPGAGKLVLEKKYRWESDFDRWDLPQIQSVVDRMWFAD